MRRLSGSALAASPPRRKSDVRRARAAPRASPRALTPRPHPAPRVCATDLYRAAIYQMCWTIIIKFHNLCLKMNNLSTHLSSPFCCVKADC